MNSRPSPQSGSSVVILAAVLVGFMGFPSLGQAQGKRKNPASKVYVAEVGGEALIDTGDALEDLTKRSVYTAQGAVIETKKPASPADRSRYYSTMVYSNGTGAFFDADTRVEVRRFVQEPFTPNRTDLEVEPSISQTQAFLSRGSIGLCTSKLVAGSNMTYQTPHASVNIRGRKLVIETGPDFTKISMIEGESTIRAGAMDMGGHTLQAGQQAIIRSGGAGQPNLIQISKIPGDDLPQLDERVAMACLAKRTVYFEERERKLDLAGPSTDTESLLNGPVSAFDGTGGTATGGTIREITPVEILPSDLPVQFTVSPARIDAGGRGPGG